MVQKRGGVAVRAGLEWGCDRSGRWVAIKATRSGRWVAKGWAGRGVFGGRGHFVEDGYRAMIRA